MAFIDIQYAELIDLVIYFTLATLPAWFSDLL